jgi:hypothetical protein
MKALIIKNSNINPLISLCLNLSLYQLWLNKNKMKSGIKNISLLRKILWVDFLFGSSAGIAGIFYFEKISNILQLPSSQFFIISIITLVYAVGALVLALQSNINILLLKIQILANWFWTLVSIVLLYLHCLNASILGDFYLIAQILVVGILAYLEGKQIQK